MRQWQGRRKVIKSVCVCGGGNWIKWGGGKLDQKSGGGANWPKVVFLFLVQGEKCGGGAPFPTPLNGKPSQIDYYLLKGG